MLTTFALRLPLLNSLLISTLLLSTACYAKVEISDISFSAEQSKASKDIISKLNQRHYIKQSLNDSLSSRIFDNYLEKLDGNRSFFLQSDLEEFEQYRLTLDDTLRKGDLEPGAIIFNRYQQRLTDRLSKIVAELPDMIAAMDFTKDETLTIDRTDSPWPTTTAEADELWRKIIKSRVLSLKLAKKEDTDIVTLLQKRYQNQLNRVKQSNSEDAFQIYMNSMTSLYDPHTNYLSPRTSENFNINMSLSLEGIGAVLQTEDEYTKVVRLVHAGPADKQGQLQPADRIVAVAQKDGEFQDVIGMRLDEVVELIRGPKGSLVKLQVIPVNATTDDDDIVIEILRDTVKLEEQSAQKKILEIYHDDKLSRIGIIDIPAFYIDFDAMRKGDPNYKSTTRDVKKLLGELVEENVDGIIIDLRENGGGSLQEANQLTGLFIEQGPTVQIRHSSNKVYRDGKRSPSAYYNGPLAVLINRLSASASEIFAGAIQDYQRGVIIGETTFGKGTVQRFFELDAVVPQRYKDLGELGSMKITIQKFFRINGGSTQLKGVIPDIILPGVYSYRKIGEKEENFPMAWTEIDPIYYKKSSIKKLDKIKKKSEKRVAANERFNMIDERAKWFKSLQEDTEVSLNLEAYRAQQEKYNKVSEQYKGINKDIPGLDIAILAADVAVLEADTIRAKSIKTWHKSLKKDPYLEEVVQIIGDWN